MSPSVKNTPKAGLHAAVRRRRLRLAAGEVLQMPVTPAAAAIIGTLGDRREDLGMPTPRSRFKPGDWMTFLATDCSQASKA